MYIVNVYALNTKLITSPKAYKIPIHAGLHKLRFRLCCVYGLGNSATAIGGGVAVLAWLGSP